MGLSLSQGCALLSVPAPGLSMDVSPQLLLRGVSTVPPGDLWCILMHIIQQLAGNSTGVAAGQVWKSRDPLLRRIWVALPVGQNQAEKLLPKELLSQSKVLLFPDNKTTGFV